MNFLLLALLCLSTSLPSSVAIREPVPQDIRNRAKLASTNSTQVPGRLTSCPAQLLSPPLHFSDSDLLSQSFMQRQVAMHWRRKALAAVAVQEKLPPSAGEANLGRPLGITLVLLMVWQAWAVSHTSQVPNCDKSGIVLSAILLLVATLFVPQLQNSLLARNFNAPFLFTFLASVAQSACYLVHWIKERTKRSDSWIVRPRVPIGQICLVGLLGVVASLLTSASFGLLGLDSLLLLMLLKLAVTSSLGHRLVTNVNETERHRLLGVSLVFVALAFLCYSSWSWDDALGKLSLSSSSSSSPSSFSSSGPLLRTTVPSAASVAATGGAAAAPTSPVMLMGTSIAGTAAEDVLVRLSGLSLALGGATAWALHTVYQRQTMDAHSVPSTLMVGLEGLLGLPLSAICLLLANIFRLEDSLMTATCLLTSSGLLVPALALATLLVAFVAWHWSGCSLGKSSSPTARALVDALALILGVALGTVEKGSGVPSPGDSRLPLWLPLQITAACLVVVGTFLYFFGDDVGLAHDDDTIEEETKFKHFSKGDLLPGL